MRPPIQEGIFKLDRTLPLLMACADSMRNRKLSHVGPMLAAQYAMNDASVLYP
jgi:hypothetical protein